MKKISLLFIALMLLFPATLIAEEEASVSGEGSVIVKAVDGENESSKFMEYRDLPDGVTGSLNLFLRKSDTYFLEFNAKNIALDDQYFKLSTGRYGLFTIDASYNKIPHRFAYDAKTIYNGIGTGSLSLSDFMQTDLQASTSLINLASTLSDYFSEAYTFDSVLFRERSGIAVNVTAFDPFNFRFEVNKEERSGTRPYFGSFGFYNVHELMEPIDYDTTDARFTVEFARKPFVITAGFYLSHFKNNVDSLIWENPFRITDAVRVGFPDSYLNPYQLGPVLINQASTKGLIDLSPDNGYRNYFLSGVVDLPMKGKLIAKASWGTMEQNDRLFPYTINTAIEGIGDLDHDGALENFDAWDASYLPVSKVDAKVETSLYTLLYTMRPTDFLNIKARYRSYEYDNQTEIIHFPGYVRTDANWEEIEVANHPSSYKKSDYGIDFGLTFLRSNTLTIGYARNNIKRKHREVAESDDDIFTVAFDSTPLSWLDIRASYEMSQREGEYDFTVPFGDEERPPQLPWLRKYDEANRDRDRAQLLLTFSPYENLTLTAQLIDGKDDFEDSIFGLLEDTHRVYSLDIDYTLNEIASVFAFGSFEKYCNKEAARQWNPGPPESTGEGDPYVTDTDIESDSNWDAKSEDTVRTIGAGFSVTPAGQKNSLHCWYSLSKAEGEVVFSSPVGGSSADTNNFEPIPFDQVDNSKLQTFNAAVKHSMTKKVALIIGYMYERWSMNDFNYDGFTYIPTLTSGAYNASLFMGTLEPKYSVNIEYIKLHFRF